ncbi:SNF2 domain-containing protein CLASSY 1-like [Aristolochia californica]|uniref:SNF2 domain-containing protein CLASSY 1-like n=1 Tax=Aristolochia californica TaxID=171875 RepID=UPI0035E3B671
MGSTPFEVFHQGSWQPTECVKIKQGGVFLQLEHHDFEREEKLVIQSLRLRSRKASSSDCQHILKPGIDICLFSSNPNPTCQAQENSQPAWHDAKIISVVRRPHGYQCMCRFFVSFYTNYNPCKKRKRTLEIAIMEISIDNIYILQKLKRNRNDGSDQVTTIQDCQLVDKNKIFGRTFSSEIAWLVVLSILSGMDFEVRVMGQRLTYLITNGWKDDNALKFERCNGFLKPKIGSILPMSSALMVTGDAVDEKTYVLDNLENECNEEFLDFIDLRRSKRQSVPPDRYISFGHFPLVKHNILKYKRQEERETRLVFESPECKSKSTQKCICFQHTQEENSDPAFSRETKNSSCLLTGKKRFSETSDNFFSFDCRAHSKKPLFDQDDLYLKGGRVNKRKNIERCSGNDEVTNFSAVPRKKLQKCSCKKSQMKYGSVSLTREKYRTREHVSNLNELKQIMENCMKSIEFEKEKLGKNPKMQTNEASHELHLKFDFEGETNLNESMESSDYEYLWKEMESAILELNFHEANQAYDLDSEPLCNTVPPMDTAKSDKHENVWSLIPNFERKLHIHQKMAFEFFWKNIAGSLNPREMENVTMNLGGCVLSHSPGSGKTLTVIAFLISYLKLFPEKRPLIIVPKITLYVWYNEFKKWGFPYPVYQIHSQRSYHSDVRNLCRNEFFGHMKLNREMKHSFDCIDKLHKWHTCTSVLLMSYSCFLSMMKKQRKSLSGQNVAVILQESPGLLILDEGHNPRSTGSKLRKALMEVKTGLRILLSGTLFQNNFVEYFNTLCLARPSFIFELVGERTRTTPVEGKKSNNLKEMRARKFFVENIANRINSNVENVRKIGLDMLSKITSGFVDVYTGGGSEKLPGMQSYTILMRSTDIQEKFLAKLHGVKQTKRSFLELELLITVGSMHPWLLTTVACAGKYFSLVELQELEKCKLDITRGSKVKFIVDLVRQCVSRREKVLIFCHNIPPIKYLQNIFELIFGWQRDQEILVLQGDQEMSERAMVMDKFKEKGGAALVLIASTTACAEGISLVAASRVALLDSEWNPAKTKQAIARAFRPGQEKEVYVYRLLASGTMEEDKYGKTALKELKSKMIFTGSHVEHPTDRKTDDIDDEVLRQLVEDDGTRAFEMIMKHEKACGNMAKGGSV